MDLSSGQDALWEAMTERTRLVWFETPSNPHLKVVDIEATVATVARRAAESGGARPLIVVDNTFASPALQRPLTLGADIVFHSATKYLAGHSDTILGIAVTSDEAAAERLRFLQNAMGAVPGPLDCFLVLRGLRTLHLRMERHGANAAAVAAFLRGAARRGDRASTRVSAGWSRSCRRRVPTVRRPPTRAVADRRGDAPRSPWPSRSAASNRSSRSRRR